MKVISIWWGSHFQKMKLFCRCKDENLNILNLQKSKILSKVWPRQLFSADSKLKSANLSAHSCGQAQMSTVSARLSIICTRQIVQISMWWCNIYYSTIVIHSFIHSKVQIWNMGFQNKCSQSILVPLSQQTIHIDCKVCTVLCPFQETVVDFWNFVHFL